MEKDYTPSKVYVKESSIDGKGMFAKKNIKKGEIVLLFKGRVFHKVNESEEDTYGNPNAIGIGKNEWINPKGNLQYINHSCNPNMGIKGKITFVALKNIEKDEELTFDYSIIEEDQNWSMTNKEKKCPGFRKKIGSIHSLPIDAYRRYMPYVPGYFQQVYNKFHHLSAYGKKR